MDGWMNIWIDSWVDLKMDAWRAPVSGLHRDELV